MRPMFGAFGKAGSANSIAFVSKVYTCLLLFLIVVVETHNANYAVQKNTSFYCRLL